MCYAFHEPLMFTAELTPYSRITLMKLTRSVSDEILYSAIYGTMSTKVHHLTFS